MSDDDTRRGIEIAASALSGAVLEILDDPNSRRRAWFAFTDDTSLPEGNETIAELAFEAGYATAMGHVGRLLERNR